MVANQVAVALLGPTWDSKFGTYWKVLLGGPQDRFCAWDCIYCRGHGSSKTQGDFPETSIDLQELVQKLRGQGSWDRVIISGRGDPACSPGFVSVVQALHQLRTETKGKWMIHCVVGGVNKTCEKVFQALDLVDELYVKLDCAQESLFRLLNRPDAGAGSLAEHLNAIRRLDRFSLLTTLWKCEAAGEYQNWTASNLEGLYRIYQELKPRGIYLSTLHQEFRGQQLLPVSDSELGTFALRVEELGIPVQVSHVFPGGDFAG